MPPFGLDIKSAVEILTALFCFGGFVIALMIKGEQGKVKEGLTKQITDHAEAFSAHEARDDEKFKNLESNVDKMDKKLDRLLERHN